MSSIQLKILFKRKKQNFNVIYKEKEKNSENKRQKISSVMESAHKIFERCKMIYRKKININENRKETILKTNKNFKIKIKLNRSHSNINFHVQY